MSNSYWPRYTCLLLVALVITTIFISGCTFWVRDIEGKIYKTIIPEQRVNQRVYFFFNRFADNLQALFPLLNGNRRLRHLLIETSSSYHDLIKNIEQNSQDDPADLYTLHQNTDRLKEEIKKELNGNINPHNYKRKELKTALHASEYLLSLLRDFNNLAWVQDP